jgi:transposase
MWCIPTITAEFKKKMLDVLEVYERPYNPDYPVVCVDEKLTQLIKDIRASLSIKAAQPRKIDYEYKRNGTCYIFVAVEPKAGKRSVRVTRRRTKKDFASFIKYLVLHVYKRAKKIILVEDNLNTHNKTALIETFGEREGKKLARKIEWHFTPKHASWLDQAEIEIHSLEEQCLDRRIPDFHTMQAEVAACARRRNRDKCGITWQFTRKKAKQKFQIGEKSY